MQCNGALPWKYHRAQAVCWEPVCMRADIVNFEKRLLKLENLASALLRLLSPQSVQCCFDRWCSWYTHLSGCSGPLIFRQYSHHRRRSERQNQANGVAHQHAGNPDQTD
jgi:hypothetical protein